VTSGKKSLSINGATFLQLAFMKFSTGTLKITLFSKRTNDFIYSQYFYKEAKTVKEITAFAKNKFIDCKVRFDMQYGSNYDV
jgi:hypothetical protein